MWFWLPSVKTNHWYFCNKKLFHSYAKSNTSIYTFLWRSDFLFWDLKSVLSSSFLGIDTSFVILIYYGGVILSGWALNSTYFGDRENDLRFKLRIQFGWSRLKKKEKKYTNRCGFRQTHYRTDDINRDENGSVWWLCGGFETRPAVIMLLTEHKLQRATEWFLNYKKLSFLNDSLVAS